MGLFLSIFYLLAVNTMQSEQLLVAGQAVVVAVLLHKALGADGLLTAAADETFLMPAVAFVLHLLGAWRKKPAENSSINFPSMSVHS